MKPYIIPFVLCSSTITILGMLLNYKMFGSESRIKKWLYFYLNRILNNKYICKYFAQSYAFYIWLFCVGENSKLLLRFNLILGFSELLTIFGIIFRVFILMPSMLSILNEHFILFAGIVFALNGLFKVFMNSGVLINTLFENKNQMIPSGDNEFFNINGNYFFRKKSVDTGFMGGTPPGDSNPIPDPEHKKDHKQSSEHTQKRFLLGKRIVAFGAAGGIIAAIVGPLAAESWRQGFETKARLETQEHQKNLSNEKTKRTQLEYETAKANADAAKANADAAKANADSFRYQAELAKETRLTELQKQTNNSSVYNRIKNSWNNKK